MTAAALIPPRHWADDERGVARIEREYQSAQRLNAEPDQQQRFAAEFLGMVSDPGRQYRGDNLWRDNEARQQQRCGLIFVQCKILADHRKHRGIGELKQENAAGKNVELQIFGQIENALKIRGGLANPRIARARIVDLIAADEAQRDQRRNASEKTA